MTVLVVYDAYSTHTNTVYEHLAMLAGLSRHAHHFLHCAERNPPDLDGYSAVVVHYGARLVIEVIEPRLKDRLAAWDGRKILFVQDEYDVTETLRCEIERLGFDLVFTCVPEDRIARIYPPARFEKTLFLPTLTGFAPAPGPRPAWRPMTDRPVWVGYRGRALPYWYGDLGQEKRRIAEQVRAACQAAGIPHDIAWTEEKRIYGPAWPAFLQSCRATLGTESGANLFDEDGAIRAGFEAHARAHPEADYATARAAVLGDRVEEPVMNQVSPRIFEAIAAGTALVLYEGRYSGVVEPERHFIALRKDGGNMAEVLDRLGDTDALAGMAARAWDDVIGSGAYSAERFIEGYDTALEGLGLTAGAPPAPAAPVTAAPLRHALVTLPPGIGRLWRSLPVPLRRRLSPAGRAMIRGLRQIARRS